MEERTPEDWRQYREQIRARLEAIAPGASRGRRRRTTIDQRARRVLDEAERQKAEEESRRKPPPQREKKLSTVVRNAVLELLAAEPASETVLVERYGEVEAERGWPPASVHTIRQQRARLTTLGRVVEVAEEIGPTGRPRKVWGAAG